jgi:APA family basic amino acid/polyamine antiporter
MTGTAPSMPEPGTERRTHELDESAAAEGLFVRRSSGLVRGIGLGGAIGVNLGVLNIGAAIGYFALTLSLFPHTDLTWTILVGGGLTGLLAFVYTQLVSVVPRSGGDYAYQGRLLHPFLGALSGGALMVVFALIIATFGSFVSQQFVPFAVQTLGSALGIGALENFADDISTQTGSFVIALVLVLGALTLTMLGVRLSTRVAFWLVIVGLVGVVVTSLQLLLHSGADFRSAFNDYADNPRAFDQVLSGAKATGFTAEVTASAVIASIPYGALMFGNFTVASFTGGELKRPTSTLKVSSLVSIGVALVIVLAAWIGLRAHASLDFVQSASALSTNDPDAYAQITNAPLTTQFYAVMVASDPVSKVLIALGFLAWAFAPIIAFLLIVSRIMFAFSFDRLLPGWLANVTARRQSPVNALLVTLVVAVAFLALVTYSTGFAAAFRNILVILTIVLVLSCLAVILLPWRHRSLYEGSPKVFQGSWLGVPIIVWVTGVAMAFQLVVLYLLLTNEKYSGGYDTTSILTLLGTFAVGPVLYVVSRSVMRRRGVDIDLAMRELPPE